LTQSIISKYENKMKPFAQGNLKRNEELNQEKKMGLFYKI
jgi:hypothetical protein